MIADERWTVALALSCGRSQLAARRLTNAGCSSRLCPADRTPRELDAHGADQRPERKRSITAVQKVEEAAGNEVDRRRHLRRGAHQRRG